MAELTVNLTTNEGEYLRRLLDNALSETRVELHRTHFNPGFRDRVQEEEKLIGGLLAKLERQVQTSP